mmetsp:Transcript_25821/g.83613  ORF Transcript_25821/g.83613 Transcript_25821/m.83613 type:complete len:403 (-) Transcript_25821:48-1256(-)
MAALRRLLLFLLVGRASSFFKLCTYNVHEGGHDLEEMFERFFVPWCEVAVVNEAKGWRQHKKGLEIATRHGFRVEILATPYGYDVAILVTKSLALARGAATTKHTFHHGLLHGVVSDGRRTVHILATHLSPLSALKRRDEARKIVEVVQRLEASPQGAAVVVAGDLNTLSPLDREVHSPELLAILRGHPRLRAKFLITPDPDSDIDYVPMKILLADLVDVAYRHASSKQRKPHTTVPTLVHEDKLHAAPMRLDYVLLNAKAAATLLDPKGHVLRVHTLLDEHTHRASDHYPLVVDLADNDDTVLPAERDGGRSGGEHTIHVGDDSPTTTTTIPVVLEKASHEDNPTPNGRQPPLSPPPEKRAAALSSSSRPHHHRPHPPHRITSPECEKQNPSPSCFQRKER